MLMQNFGWTNKEYYGIFVLANISCDDDRDINKELFVRWGETGGREPGRQGDRRVTGDGRVEGGKRE